MKAKRKKTSWFNIAATLRPEKIKYIAYHEAAHAIVTFTFFVEPCTRAHTLVSEVQMP